MNINHTNKIFLVTLGTHFNGSNLCQSLLYKTNKVTYFYNFATAKRENTGLNVD